MWIFQYDWGTGEYSLRGFYPTVCFAYAKQKKDARWVFGYFIVSHLDNMLENSIQMWYNKGTRRPISYLSCFAYANKPWGKTPTWRILANTPNHYWNIHVLEVVMKKNWHSKRYKDKKREIEKRAPRWLYKENKTVTKEMVTSKTKISVEKLVTSDEFITKGDYRFKLTIETSLPQQSYHQSFYIIIHNWTGNIQQTKF